MYKVLEKLRLTSGEGIVGLGGFWLIYGLIQRILVTPESAIQQQVQEIMFLQAETGLVIIALGIIVMQIKKRQEYKDKDHPKEEHPGEKCL